MCGATIESQAISQTVAVIRVSVEKGYGIGSLSTIALSERQRCTCTEYSKNTRYFSSLLQSREEQWAGLVSHAFSEA